MPPGDGIGVSMNSSRHLVHHHHFSQHQQCKLIIVLTAIQPRFKYSAQLATSDNLQTESNSLAEGNAMTVT
jgi:hypothetical protein